MQNGSTCGVSHRWIRAPQPVEYVLSVRVRLRSENAAPPVGKRLSGYSFPFQEQGGEIVKVPPVFQEIDEMGALRRVQYESRDLPKPGFISKGSPADVEHNPQRIRLIGHSTILAGDH